MAFKEACTLSFMAAGLALHLKVEVTAKPEIVESRILIIKTEGVTSTNFNYQLCNV